MSAAFFELSVAAIKAALLLLRQLPRCHSGSARGGGGALRAAAARGGLSREAFIDARASALAEGRHARGGLRCA